MSASFRLLPFSLSLIVVIDHVIYVENSFVAYDLHSITRYRSDFTFQPFLLLILHTNGRHVKRQINA